MFARMFAIAGTLGLAAGLLAALEPPLLAAEPGRRPAKEEREAVPRASDADTDRIAELIRSLDANEFRQREAAGAELKKIGEPAVAALRKALQDSRSLEVKVRAKKILGTICPVTLEAIFEQVRLANQGKLDARRLESLLSRLQSVLSKATGVNGSSLPVKFSEVHPAKAEVSNRGALIIAKNVSITSLRKSIVLCDAEVRITSARDSIIISRLAVRITGAENCIVISGYDLDMNGAKRGIFLSGGHADFTSFDKAIVGAATWVSATSGQDTTIVNTARDDVGRRDRVRAQQVKGLVLRADSSRNTLAKKIRLTFADSSGLALFRLKNGKGEYVARVDQPINHPDGGPIKALQGWKLVRVRENYAIFSNGDRYSYFPVTTK